MATISLSRHSASLVLEDICDDMDDSEGDQVSFSEEECPEAATATSCASSEKASLHPMTLPSSAQKSSPTDNMAVMPLSSHKEEEEEEESTPEAEKSTRISPLFKRVSCERPSPHSSSLQTTREDEEMVFHNESFSSGSDENEFDSGGPRWSKPELNESLNQSVRIVQKWARK
jgi:hypothetical protein